MKLTRRTFLVAGALVGGGLMVGLGGVGAWIATYDRRAKQQAALTTRDGSVEGMRVVAQWITVAPDGQVTIYTPHNEMGQGSATGILQIVLDELDADPARTRILEAPADGAFDIGEIVSGLLDSEVGLRDWQRRFVDQTMGRLAPLGNLQFTGASTSTRFTGWRALRRAAAGARVLLAQAAADRWGVSVADVRTDSGAVHHPPSERRLDYGELATDASRLPVPASPPFKDRASWRFIGTRHPRIDLPDKIYGRAEYGIDREVPGARFVAVAPPTVARGTVQAVTNEADVIAMRGVEAVIVLGDAVAVVADNPWRAEQAARAVTMDVLPPPGGPFDEAALRQARETAVRTGELSAVTSRGEATRLADDAGAFEAVYETPFLAHVPMEPLNASIWEEGGRVHVAAGVQGPLGARAAVADVLGRPLSDVAFHAHTMGGGFGRRVGIAEDSLNWILMTAKVWQQVGGALKMIWSREAGLRLSTYRPADMVRFRARLDDAGRPVVWNAASWAKVLNPREVVPPYDIPDVLVTSASAEPALPFAYWRSVDSSSHVFFMESFVDELAHAAGADPLAFRLSMLGEGHERMAAVLRKAAAMAGWEEPRGQEERALGIACAHCFGSFVAEVAEVSIEDGRPRVHRVWAAVDCGLAVNPGSVEAQIQGGIHFGLSAALYGAIRMDEGAIVQSNFHDYPVVTFRDAPVVEVAVLETPDAHVGGIGEVGTPPIAPAVANALAALGDRRRALPLVS